MFMFVFSLYPKSPGPTSHLDYDLLECDAIQALEITVSEEPAAFFEAAISYKTMLLVNQCTRRHARRNLSGYAHLPEPQSSRPSYTYIYIYIYSHSFIWSVGRRFIHKSILQFIHRPCQAANHTSVYSFIFLTNYILINQ